MMADTAEYGGAHPGGAPSGEGGSPTKDIGPAREEGGQGSGAGSSVSAGSILDCFSYLNQSQADAAPFVPLLAWLSGFDSPSPQSAGVPEECRAGGEEDTDRSRSVQEESGASAEYLVGLPAGQGGGNDIVPPVPAEQVTSDPRPVPPGGGVPPSVEGSGAFVQKFSLEELRLRGLKSQSAILAGGTRKDPVYIPGGTTGGGEMWSRPLACMDPESGRSPGSMGDQGSGSISRGGPPSGQGGSASRRWNSAVRRAQAQVRAGGVLRELCPGLVAKGRPTEYGSVPLIWDQEPVLPAGMEALVVENVCSDQDARNLFECQLEGGQLRARTWPEFYCLDPEEQQLVLDGEITMEAMLSILARPGRERVQVYGPSAQDGNQWGGNGLSSMGRWDHRVVSARFHENWESEYARQLVREMAEDYIDKSSHENGNVIWEDLLRRRKDPGSGQMWMSLTQEQLDGLRADLHDPDMIDPVCVALSADRSALALESSPTSGLPRMSMGNAGARPSAAPAPVGPSGEEVQGSGRVDGIACASGEEGSAGVSGTAGTLGRGSGSNRPAVYMGGAVSASGINGALPLPAKSTGGGQAVPTLRLGKSMVASVSSGDSVTAKSSYSGPVVARGGPQSSIGATGRPTAIVRAIPEAIMGACDGLDAGDIVTKYLVGEEIYGTIQFEEQVIWLLEQMSAAELGQCKEWLRTLLDDSEPDSVLVNGSLVEWDEVMVHYGAVKEKWAACLDVCAGRRRFHAQYGIVWPDPGILAPALGDSARYGIVDPTSSPAGESHGGGMGARAGATGRAGGEPAEAPSTPGKSRPRGTRPRVPASTVPWYRTGQRLSQGAPVGAAPEPRVSESGAGPQSAAETMGSAMARALARAGPRVGTACAGSGAGTADAGIGVGKGSPAASVLSTPAKSPRVPRESDDVSRILDLSWTDTSTWPAEEQEVEWDGSAETQPGAGVIWGDSPAWVTFITGLSHGDPAYVRLAQIVRDRLLVYVHDVAVGSTYVSLVGAIVDMIMEGHPREIMVLMRDTEEITTRVMECVTILREYTVVDRSNKKGPAPRGTDSATVDRIAVGAVGGGLPTSVEWMSLSIGKDGCKYAVEPHRGGDMGPVASQEHVVSKPATGNGTAVGGPVGQLSAEAQEARQQLVQLESDLEQANLALQHQEDEAQKAKDEAAEVRAQNQELLRASEQAVGDMDSGKSRILNDDKSDAGKKEKFDAVWSALKELHTKLENNRVALRDKEDMLVSTLTWEKDSDRIVCEKAVRQAQVYAGTLRDRMTELVKDTYNLSCRVGSRKGGDRGGAVVAETELSPPADSVLCGPAKTSTARSFEQWIRRFFNKYCPDMPCMAAWCLYQCSLKTSTEVKSLEEISDFKAWDLAPDASYHVMRKPFCDEVRRFYQFCVSIFPETLKKLYHLIEFDDEYRKNKVVLHAPRDGENAQMLVVFVNCEHRRFSVLLQRKYTKLMRGAASLVATMGAVAGTKEILRHYDDAVDYGVVVSYKELCEKLYFNLAKDGRYAQGLSRWTVHDPLLCDFDNALITKPGGMFGAKLMLMNIQSLAAKVGDYKPDTADLVSTISETASAYFVTSAEVQREMSSEGASFLDVANAVGGVRTKKDWGAAVCPNTKCRFCGKGCALGLVKHQKENNRKPPTRCTACDEKLSRLGQLTNLNGDVVKAWVPRPKGKAAAVTKGDDSKKGFCFKFQKGQCKFGDKCRFKHEMVDESANAVGDAGGKGKYGPKPGDWECPKCQCHNFAKRTECFKCSVAKPAEGTAAAVTEEDPAGSAQDGAMQWSDA
jgi:hypothetical protein